MLYAFPAFFNSPGAVDVASYWHCGLLSQIAKHLSENR